MAPKAPKGKARARGAPRRVFCFQMKTRKIESRLTRVLLPAHISCNDSVSHRWQGPHGGASSVQSVRHKGAPPPRPLKCLAGQRSGRLRVGATRPDHQGASWSDRRLPWVIWHHQVHGRCRLRSRSDHCTDARGKRKGGGNVSATGQPASLPPSQFAA